MRDTLGYGQPMGGIAQTAFVVEDLQAARSCRAAHSASLHSISRLSWVAMDFSPTSLASPS